MKIGCHTLQWGLGIDEKTRYTWDGRIWNTTLDEALRGISKLGYAGFECTESDLPPFFSNTEGFRAMLRNDGLAFVSVWNTLFPKSLAPGERATVNPNLPMNDPGQFKVWCIKSISPDDIRKDFAAKSKFAETVRSLGGECITYGGPFMLRADIREDYYKFTGELLNDLGEKLKSMGMRLAYHAHLSTLVQNSEDIDRLYQYADKSVVGLCLDTAHLTAAGDDPATAVRRYLPRLSNMHLKDELDGKFVELGRGRIDIAGTIRTLVEGGYPYWAMVELDIPSEPPYESALISKRYLDDILRTAA
jgi:inosose dehydratase